MPDQLVGQQRGRRGRDRAAFALEGDLGDPSLVVEPDRHVLLVAAERVGVLELEVGVLERGRSCAAACSARGSGRGRARPCRPRLAQPAAAVQQSDWDRAAARLLRGFRVAQQTPHREVCPYSASCCSAALAVLVAASVPAARLGAGMTYERRSSSASSSPPSTASVTLAAQAACLGRPQGEALPGSRSGPDKLLGQ